MNMSERKLATIRQVDSVEPIPGADNIEVVQIGGWKVVSAKSANHHPGDSVVYFEIDSFLPESDERFASFCERGVKTMDGVRGHVLKTIKLRGTWSQGAIMPLSEFPEITPIAYTSEGPMYCGDVTEALGITKYEKPIPPDQQGLVKSSTFPAFMRKTDAERVQNLDELFPLDRYWVATEKIDGTSATYAVDVDGEFWVCSRNQALLPSNNVYWRIAEKYGIEDHLRMLQSRIIGDGTRGNTNVVLQGEIYGEGIQANPLGIKGIDFAAFNLQIGLNIHEAANMGYCGPVRPDLPKSMRWSPIYEDLEPPQSVGGAVEQVEGLKSLISPQRQAEGVVWWRTLAPWTEGADLDIPRNAKAINNKFLAKQKD